MLQQEYNYTNCHCTLKINKTSHTVHVEKRIQGDGEDMQVESITET